VHVTIPKRPLVALNGFIEGFTSGEVALSVDCLIPVHRQVRIEFNGSQLDGEVIGCRATKWGFRANILIYDFDEAGLRRTPRFPVLLEARLYEAGTGDPVDACIVDISSDGLGIELAKTLVVDEMVAIETASSTTFATVKHCKPLSVGRYRAGVSMLYVMRKQAPRTATKLEMLRRFWTALWRRHQRGAREHSSPSST